MIYIFLASKNWVKKCRFWLFMKWWKKLKSKKIKFLKTKYFFSTFFRCLRVYTFKKYRCHTQEFFLVFYPLLAHRALTYLMLFCWGIRICACLFDRINKFGLICNFKLADFEIISCFSALSCTNKLHQCFLTILPNRSSSDQTEFQSLFHCSWRFL